MQSQAMQMEFEEETLALISARQKAALTIKLPNLAWAH
jgi:hypothetical protein